MCLGNYFEMLAEKIQIDERMKDVLFELKANLKELEKPRNVLLLGE